MYFYKSSETCNTKTKSDKIFGSIFSKKKKRKITKSRFTIFPPQQLARPPPVRLTRVRLRSSSCERRSRRLQEAKLPPPPRPPQPKPTRGRSPEGGGGGGWPRVARTRAAALRSPSTGRSSSPAGSSRRGSKQVARHRRILFRPSPSCVDALVGLWGSVSRFWQTVIAHWGSAFYGTRAAG